MEKRRTSLRSPHEQTQENVRPVGGGPDRGPRGLYVGVWPIYDLYLGARAKEVSQSGGVRRGVRGCIAFLLFFNTKIPMGIPDVFLYSDSLRKRYIAHCYGELCACGLHCASSEEWLRDNSMDTRAAEIMVHIKPTWLYLVARDLPPHARSLRRVPSRPGVRRRLPQPRLLLHPPLRGPHLRLCRHSYPVCVFRLAGLGGQQPGRGPAPAAAAAAPPPRRPAN